VIRRDVITVGGADARGYLHSQLSNDVASLTVGASAYSFILEPTGKLSALVRVRCSDDDCFVLDVDEGCGASTLARLNKFKIRVTCEFELSTQEVVTLRGLDAAARKSALGVPGAVAAWRPDDGAVDVFGAEVPTVGGDTDARQYHEERVRCGWPIFGVDIDTDTIPAESSLVDVCVSFTKGCYPGQELVERMDSRGSTAPRRLMRLPAQPATGLPRVVAGGEYLLNGTAIGRCTSVAGDHALVMVARAHLGDVEGPANS
jgi:folate-binding protein YgfZ